MSLFLLAAAGCEQASSRDRICSGGNSEYAVGSIPAVRLSLELDCIVETQPSSLPNCSLLYYQYELADGATVRLEQNVVGHLSFDYRPHDGVAPQISLQMSPGAEQHPMEDGFLPVVSLLFPRELYRVSQVPIGDLTAEDRTGCAFTYSCVRLMLRAISQNSGEYQLGVPTSGVLHISAAGAPWQERVWFSAIDVPLKPATALYNEVLCEDGRIHYTP